MKIAFQADEDLNQSIINAVLRMKSEIKFITAFDAGMKGFTDLQVLELCAKEQRVLVSHDYRTMPNYFAEFINQNISCGVIIAPKRLSVAEVAENIILIWEISDSEEWINRIAVLPF